MKHYFSIASKSKGLDILDIRFGTINLDVQYMNKAIVETVLDNEFKRNTHRKYSVVFPFVGGKFNLPYQVFTQGQSIQTYRVYKQFSTKGDFAPRLHVAMSRNIFGCHTGGSNWHLVGRDTGMLLNTLQHTRQSPPQRLTHL